MHLSGTGLYPKGGLGSGTVGHGTRTKDHGTLISLALHPGSRIEKHDARCTARGSIGPVGS